MHCSIYLSIYSSPSQDLPEIVLVPLLDHGNEEDYHEGEQPGVRRDWGVDQQGQHKGYLWKMDRLLYRYIRNG